MAVLTGRCLCGAVRYEYEGAPPEVFHCHCESCRRHASSPITAFLVNVEAAALRFTATRPKEFQSSPGVWRSFCADCGSPVTYRSQRHPGKVDVYVGTLTDPTAVRPTGHVHSGEQLPWFETLDDLPRFHASRVDVEPSRYGPRRSR